MVIKSTPDLCDQYPELVRVLDPIFVNYGGRESFSGPVLTVKCFEDNSIVKQLVGTPGNSRVLVVDAAQLVRKRAELMQAAVPSGSGSMAAILGLDDASVIEICVKASDKGVVEAVNFNSPGQVVIAGEKDAVAHACELMKEAGAKRALVLPVSVPSHCSLMTDAAAEFKISVDTVNFQMGNERVIHNVDADYARDVEEIKSKLVEQLHKPVLWTSSVEKMKKLGVEKIIEVGPGKILAGLTRRIDKSLSGSAIIDVATLKSTIEGLS